MIVGMSEVTQILSAIEAGDPKGAAQLLPLVYDELRKLAAARMAEERADHTLQPTALVHEAYVRLVGSGPSRDWKGRSHFFAAAAEAMRRILVDVARRKLADKRGANPKRHTLDGLSAPERDEELIALDDALRKLAEIEPQKARLVELRYFAGLTAEQAADALSISPTTADRYWAYARAWLQAEVRGR
jgi:RNA polymerase sigma factor (TIGR02999 family)